MPDRNTYLQSLKGMQRIKQRLHYAIEKMEINKSVTEPVEVAYRKATSNYSLITKNIRAMRTLINQTYHHGKAIV